MLGKIPRIKERWSGTKVTAWKKHQCFPFNGWKPFHWLNTFTLLILLIVFLSATAMIFHLPPCLAFPQSPNLCRHIYLTALSSQKTFRNGCVIVSCSYLSTGTLVLLSLQEVQKYLQQSWVLPVWFHHVTSAGHKLSQGPKSHLQRSSPEKISFDQGIYYVSSSISHSTSAKLLWAF